MDQLTPSQEMIFLYLGRRDKNGVRILSRLGKGKCLPTRLNDASNLPIDIGIRTDINNQVNISKIKWELWIESAVSYTDLVKKLKIRGYSNIPVSDKPELSD